MCSVSETGIIHQYNNVVYSEVVSDVDYRKSGNEQGISSKPQNNIGFVLNPAQGVIYEYMLITVPLALPT